jgi:multiple antibiotic resistance protein
MRLREINDLSDTRRPELSKTDLTVFVLAIVLVALLLATRIQRLLGAAGIMVVTQIMGLILAAFSVQQMLDGFVEVFRTAP